MWQFVSKKFRPIQHNHPPPTRTTLDQDIIDEIGNQARQGRKSSAIEKVSSLLYALLSYLLIIFFRAFSVLHLLKIWRNPTVYPVANKFKMKSRKYATQSQVTCAWTPWSKCACKAKRWETNNLPYFLLLTLRYRLFPDMERRQATNSCITIRSSLKCASFLRPRKGSNCSRKTANSL